MYGDAEYAEGLMDQSLVMVWMGFSNHLMKVEMDMKFFKRKGDEGQRW